MNSIVLNIEKFFFEKSGFFLVLTYCLAPLSWIYCLFMVVRRYVSHPKKMAIPVVSIGNLIVGGAGKTPVTIALTHYFSLSAIVLRGYGRMTKGLKIISHEGEVFLTPLESGDEAYLLATTLKNVTVIVCDDRQEGIQKAYELGRKVVFLDDGFSKVNIKKFEILIDVVDIPRWCLPIGAYREPHFFLKKADYVLKENSNYYRKVSCPKGEFVCITAIARGERLRKYLPKNTPLITFKDHHIFTQEEIQKILDIYPSRELLVTAKDSVKIGFLNIPHKILELDVELPSELLQMIQRYIDDYNS